MRAHLMKTTPLLLFNGVQTAVIVVFLDIVNFNLANFSTSISRGGMTLIASLSPSSRPSVFKADEVGLKDGGCDDASECLLPTATNIGADTLVHQVFGEPVDQHGAVIVGSFGICQEEFIPDPNGEVMNTFV